MKVGDLVYIMIDECIDPNWTGVIVGNFLESGWYEVLRCDGRIIQWPPEQMRKINEKY
jgi:hypothetical protein